MDPYSILGLDVGASDAEIAAAYRRLAKEWHPDVHGTEAAMRRMVAINAAYAQLRSAPAPEEKSPAPRAGGEVPRALGPELRGVLRPDEVVIAYGRAATWNSPEAFLVVTSVRLLWLLDDAVTHRVRSLALDQVASVDVELGRVRRRRATLRVASRRGRSFEFAELDPATARAIAAGVSAGSGR